MSCNNFLQVERLFETTTSPNINDVIDMLSRIRTSVVLEETDLQTVIADFLSATNVSFIKEYRLGPRNRIDFMIEGGIGIEVKKGKPNRTSLINQITRYASFSQIQTLLVVTERNICLPNLVNGKPCMALALNKLWGIAI